MGTQRPVMIGEELPQDLGGPIAEHHGKSKEKGKSKKAKVEEKIKEQKFEKKEKLVEAEMTKEEPKETADKSKKKIKVGKAKIRSKKYQEVSGLIDQKKIYDLTAALELVKKTTLSKFDGKVEAHIRLLSKTGKPENVRGTVRYPHQTGKKIKEYKTDSSGIIHQVIGKVSDEPKILEENFRALLNVLPKEKNTSIHLCATMGPAIKVLTK